MGRYSRQFKQEAIKLVTEQGYQPADAARKLANPDSTLLNWVQKSGWVRPQEKLADDPAVLQVQLREARARLEEEGQCRLCPVSGPSGRGSIVRG